MSVTVNLMLAPTGRVHVAEVWQPRLVGRTFCGRKIAGAWQQIGGARDGAEVRANLRGHTITVPGGVTAYTVCGSCFRAEATWAYGWRASQGTAKVEGSGG